MTEPELLETQEEGVVTLTLNRPAARNALTDTLMDALLAALRRLAVDESARVIVLTGAGDAFCAGGDVGGIAARAEGEHQVTPERRAVLLRERMEISRLLHDMPKPTLAVIGGAAAGAGLALALACDLRLAAQEAKLLTAFSGLGLSGDFGGSYFLVQLVGPARARDLYFRGATLSGAEAAALGLVNEVAPRSELAALAARYARELAERPSIALGLIKRNLNLAETSPLSAVLDAEATSMVFSSTTQEHRAAVARYARARAAKTGQG